MTRSRLRSQVPSEQCKPQQPDDRERDRVRGVDVAVDSLPRRDQREDDDEHPGCHPRTPVQRQFFKERMCRTSHGAAEAMASDRRNRDPAKEAEGDKESDRERTRQTPAKRRSRIAQPGPFGRHGQQGRRDSNPRSTVLEMTGRSARLQGKAPASGVCAPVLAPLALEGEPMEVPCPAAVAVMALPEPMLATQ